ncbi:hypothetical protein K505DRAFT_188783, partial [Melanomma pulvis-pyrius CBS 109.77]
SYRWDQVTVFLRRHISSGIGLIVCLDCPFLPQFLTILGSAKLNRPEVWHMTLLEHIIGLYDQSVWNLRNWVRSAELDRRPASAFEPNFVRLHEVARHLIHSNETLDVAVDTMKSIRRMIEATQRNENEPAHVSGRSRLNEFCEEMKRIKRRSESLGERLKNEINLAFNLVAQRDSQIMVQLSGISRRDNSNMRSVAMVGLIYLPATFVTGLFGMNFFQFCGNPGDETWKVSDKVYLYWAVTVPLTLATILVW